MNEVRKDFRAFAIGNEQITGISLAKQKTTPGAAHLVISLGGSGADMLLETKGMINLYCCSDNDQNMAPERVKFLAFDCDREVMFKESSRQTGQVRLEEEEAVLFCQNGLLPPVGFGSKPWISKWLDKGICVNYAGISSGAIRQVGRLLLFFDLNRVIYKIRDAVSRLVVDGKITSLTIDLLTGLSGGTGSGTFLDMAYIVRKVAEEQLLNWGRHDVKVEVCGYFLMPDVALRRASDEARPVLLRNGGAALQELEKAMKKAQNGELYTCQYSDWLCISTEKAPFDYVYLISQNGIFWYEDENDFEGIYEACVRNAACGILSDVTYADSAECFRGRQLRSDLQYKANHLEPGSDFMRCYTSLSCSSWEIPVEYVTKCIFTAAFEGIDDDALFTEPEQEDVYRLFRKMELPLEVKMKRLESVGILRPLSADDFSSDQLFGPYFINLMGRLPSENELWGSLDRINHDDLVGFRIYLLDEVRKSFTDPDKGPRWINRLLHSDSVKNYKGLDQLIREEKRTAEMARHNLRNEVEQMSIRINDYFTRTRESIFYRTMASRRKEYIEMVNEYARKKAQLMYLEILLTDVIDFHGGFYDQALQILAELEGDWIRAGYETLEEIRNVYVHNIKELNPSAGRKRWESYDWRTGYIPKPYRTFQKELSKNGVEKRELSAQFLEMMFQKYCNWNRNDDCSVIELINEFLDRWAGNLFHVPLEILIEEYFEEGYSVNKSVKRDLMSYLAEKAKHHLAEFEGGIDAEMLIAPSTRLDENPEHAGSGSLSGNSLIEQGIESFGIERNGVEHPVKVLSSLRYRIGVVCQRFGLAIRDLDVYEMCMQELKNDPDSAGLFLMKE